MDKIDRQLMIRDVVARGAIKNQAQLVKELRARGVRVTQATVSRDIAEMSLVRARRGTTAYYELGPGLRGEPLDALRRLMAEFVNSASVSGNLVVLRTAPATANVVAGAMDRAGLSQLLGTVAGDDTIVAVAASSKSSKELQNMFERWLG